MPRGTIWLLSILLSTASLADVPRTIDYQGRLMDASGKPVADSESNVLIIRLYSSDQTTILWTKPYTGVTTKNGYFDLALGDETSAWKGLDFNQQYFIGTQIGGDNQELSPRQALKTAPYALSVANGSITTNKLAPEAMISRAQALGITDSNTNNAVSLDAEGNVEISKSIKQEAWIAPQLVNGWQNYQTEYWNPAGYFRDKEGIVHLRGMVMSGGVNSIVFNLPVGYRPEHRELHVINSCDIRGRVDIWKDGEVVFVQGDNRWISLDGITFRADGY